MNLPTMNRAPADEGGGDAPVEVTEATEVTEVESTQSTADLIKGEEEDVNQAPPQQMDEGDEEVTEPKTDLEPNEDGKYDNPHKDLADKFWDDERGEVKVDDLSRALKEAQTALRNKGALAPEPSDENPLGYDVEFLQDEAFQGDPAFDTDDDGFKEFANQARDMNLNNDQFKGVMEQFNQWKTAYDEAVGIGIDPQMEAQSFISMFDKGDRQDVKEAFANWWHNDEQIPERVKWGLSLTGDGCKFMYDNFVAGQGNQSPMESNRGDRSGTVKDAAYFQREEAKLRQDPRIKMPHGSPERDSLEGELTNLFKEKTEAGLGKQRNPEMSHSGAYNTGRYGDGGDINRRKAK